MAKTERSVTKKVGTKQTRHFKGGLGLINITHQRTILEDEGNFKQFGATIQENNVVSTCFQEE